MYQTNGNQKNELHLNCHPNDSAGFPNNKQHSLQSNEDSTMNYASVFHNNNFDSESSLGKHFSRGSFGSQQDESSATYTPELSQKNYFHASNFYPSSYANYEKTFNTNVTNPYSFLLCPPTLSSNGTNKTMTSATKVTRDPDFLENANVKKLIESHPLFPLLQVTFHRLELATILSQESESSKNNETTINERFENDGHSMDKLKDVGEAASSPSPITSFITSQSSCSEDIDKVALMLAQRNSSYFTNSTEIDAFMIEYIRVLRLHLLEIEKVHSFCSDFCSRYQKTLSGRMPLDVVMNDDSFRSVCTTNSSITGCEDGDDQQLSRPSSCANSIFSSGGKSKVKYAARQRENNKTYNITKIKSDCNIVSSVKEEEIKDNGQSNCSDLASLKADDMSQRTLYNHENKNGNISKMKQLDNVNQFTSSSKKPTGTATKICSSEKFLESKAMTKQVIKKEGNQHHVMSNNNSSTTMVKKRGIFPKSATNTLRSWLFNHLTHPYPSEEQKKELSKMTGLTILQVNNWFINARRRVVQPMLDASNRNQQGSVLFGETNFDESTMTPLSGLDVSTMKKSHKESLMGASATGALNFFQSNNLSVFNQADPNNLMNLNNCLGSVGGNRGEVNEIFRDPATSFFMGQQFASYYANQASLLQGTQSNNGTHNFFPSGNNLLDNSKEYINGNVTPSSSTLSFSHRFSGGIS